MSGSSDTIFAKSSGAGKAGVAVFRISGKQAETIAMKLVGRSLPERAATYVTVKDPENNLLIDRGMAILFKGPRSFNGEDTLELQLHGSRAVETALYDALRFLHARPADAGEFTLRAFKNGKLDLAQAEALSDLLEAETILQRKQALGQLEGRLSAVAEAWRGRVLAIMAPLEAEIDFPDEGGVPAEIAARAVPEIAALKKELRAYLDQSGSAKMIREGVSIAVIGAPNAGKSSLVNQLAGSDVAIVSQTPGTTRDVIEARLDLGGLCVTIFDTAGLRDQTTDDIELAGIAKAKERAVGADVRVMVVDGASIVSRETFLKEGNESVSRETLALLQSGDAIIWNKSDIGSVLLANDAGPYREFDISAKTGKGITDLLASLCDGLSEDALTDGPALTRARHIDAVEAALASLERAEMMVSQSPELAAEDARMAVRNLGSITGEVGVEDILGEIFSSFCIGK